MRRRVNYFSADLALDQQESPTSTARPSLQQRAECWSGVHISPRGLSSTSHPFSVHLPVNKQFKPQSDAESSTSEEPRLVFVGTQHKRQMHNMDPLLAYPAPPSHGKGSRFPVMSTHDGAVGMRQAHTPPFSLPGHPIQDREHLMQSFQVSATALSLRRATQVS
jgi:hypothetical protein